MERREFLKKFFTRLFYLISGIVIAYPAFSFMTFRRSTKKVIIFSKEEQQSHVTLKQDVYLIRETGKVFALSAQCSHLGCLLNYDQISKKFRCPCHGSIFNLTGQWIGGPAKKDLYKIPITEKANGGVSVTIRL